MTDKNYFTQKLKVDKTFIKLSRIEFLEKNSLIKI